MRSIGREQRKKVRGNYSWPRSVKYFGHVTGRLQKGFDLPPGNQDFADGLAGGETATGNEPPDCFSAAIEGGGGLFDVVNQAFGL